MSQPVRLATAEWANPDDVAARRRFKPGAFWLGRSPAEPPVPLGYADDRHVCLFSGSRGGKGATIIINNLCLWEGSVVVIDPKGENASVTAARRGAGSEFAEGMRQAVHVLDPYEVATVDQKVRSRFNPLAEIDPDDELAPDKVGRLAETLVVKSNSSDPYWDDSARTMLKTIILHVLTSPHFKGCRNLITVRRLITHGDEKFYADMVQDTVLRTEGKKTTSPRELLWVAIANNGQHDGKISGPGMMFLEIYRHSKPQYESVLQVVSRNTEFIDSEAIKRCLVASDFKLSELKTRPEGLSLYLSLPQPEMADKSRWLRMMIGLIVNEMQAIPGPPARGHRVLICLDEFAGLERMDSIVNGVAQIAGFGVKLFFCLQTLEQLQKAYPGQWETFLANCGLKICFNVGEQLSRDYISKFIGETEIIRTTQSVGENFSTTRSTTTNTGESTADTKGDGTTKSTNSGTNHGTSRGQSRNWGGSRSTGTNEGTSVSHNWGLNPILFRTTSKFLSLLRHDETTNRGSSRGTNTNDGESWGGGDSFSENTGESHGTGEAIAHNTSQTVTKTTGTAVADGTTTGTSGTLSEGVHKRPLITPDEIGFHFATVEDAPAADSPGLAIVLASGERPIVVRRVNYYVDAEFAGCYDRNPMFPNTKLHPLWSECPVLVPEEAELAPLWEVCPAATPLMLDAWHTTEGEATGRGQPLARLKIGWRQTPNDRPIWLTAELPVPFSGTLTRFASRLGELQPDQELAFIRLNRRKAHLEQAEPLPDYIEKLVALLAEENERKQQDRNVQAIRTVQQRQMEEARIESDRREAEQRLRAFLDRAKAHEHFNNTRCRGWARRWNSYLKGITDSLMVLYVVGALVTLVVLMVRSKLEGPRTAYVALFTLVPGFFLFSYVLSRIDDWLGLPTNPPDAEDANVTVQADGTMTIMPTNPSGYLSQGEVMAFVKTAMLHDKLIKEGIRIPESDPSVSISFDLSNRYRLCYVARINGLKVINRAEIESAVSTQRDLKKDIERGWWEGVSKSEKEKAESSSK